MSKPSQRYIYVCTNQSCREVALTLTKQPDDLKCPACSKPMTLDREPTDLSWAEKARRNKERAMHGDNGETADILCGPSTPVDREPKSTHHYSCSCGFPGLECTGPVSGVAVLCPYCSKPLLCETIAPEEIRFSQGEWNPAPDDEIEPQELTNPANPQETIRRRSQVHGPFIINAGVSQNLKSVIRLRDGYARLSIIQKESLDLICHKIGRILAGDPDWIDHWADIAGYATLVVNDLTAKEEAAGER